MGYIILLAIIIVLMFLLAKEIHINEELTNANESIRALYESSEEDNVRNLTEIHHLRKRILEEERSYVH